MTTKGLCHLQMKENVVYKSQQTSFTKVQHIAGRVNTSDILIKEDCNSNHFCAICDASMSSPLIHPAHPNVAKHAYIIILHGLNTLLRGVSYLRPSTPSPAGTKSTCPPSIPNYYQD